MVDDSAAVRERLLALCAQLPGIELCGGAGSVEEAAALVRRERPDVLLLDIHLGALTGFDLLRQILPERPELEVIMITSGAIAPYQAMARRFGVRHLVDKARDVARLPGLLGEQARARLTVE